MQELEKKVLEWAKQKGILLGSEATREAKIAQFLKIIEERRELFIAIHSDDRVGIEDGFGDVFVTLIISAAQNNVEIPWGEISTQRLTGLTGLTDRLIFRLTIEIDALAEKLAKNTTIVEHDYFKPLVLLYRLCHRLNFKPGNALQVAYDVISKRKGKMQNDVFLKDE